MATLQAKQAWAVSFTPEKLLEISEEYGAEALNTLNEHLAKGDYVVLSNDSQAIRETWLSTFRPAPRSPTGP
jgi:hypothetical protein